MPRTLGWGCLLLYRLSHPESSLEMAVFPDTCTRYKTVLIFLAGLSGIRNCLLTVADSGGGQAVVIGGVRQIARQCGNGLDVATLHNQLCMNGLCLAYHLSSLTRRPSVSLERLTYRSSFPARSAARFASGIPRTSAWGYSCRREFPESDANRQTSRRTASVRSYDRG